MNAVEQQLGPVDILINNAGVVAPLVPTAHLRPVDIEQAMRPKFLAAVIVSAAYRVRRRRVRPFRTSRALIKPGGQCARWPLRWRTRPMTSSGMSLPMAPLE